MDKIEYTGQRSIRYWFQRNPGSPTEDDECNQSPRTKLGINELHADKPPNWARGMAELGRFKFVNLQVFKIGAWKVLYGINIVLHFADKQFLTQFTII